MAEDFGRRIWEELALDVQDRIVSFLEPNEIACNVRLTCKAAAARYSGPQHTRVRLSQRVPAHAFAHRWGHPEAIRSLYHKLRKQLLCLTAASGSIPNLQLLLPLVGCALDSDVLTAAASAGHQVMSQWLRQQGCRCDNSVVEAAGRSGSRALCDWLIAIGCPGGAGSALEGAASAGHVGLVDQLLAAYGPPDNRVSFLAEAAGGCDLSTLRRLHAALLKDEVELGRSRGFVLYKAAAGSASPDWREKLEWLEAQGHPRSLYASIGAARCPDALDRLTWLAGRGWLVHPGRVASEAVKRGDVETLRFVMEAEGGQGGPDAHAKVRRLGGCMVHLAAQYGQLPVLQYLHGCGCTMEYACQDAAACGHLHVVAWLVEALGAEAVLSEEVFYYAARSGSLPLLTWLRERGCVCRDASVLVAALASFMGRGACSEEVLEWLLAQGCCMQLSTTTWKAPPAAATWPRWPGCAAWAAPGPRTAAPSRRW